MPLFPGSCLGRYEIVSLVGSGGMGEVYRARDPRLGREVAVKVLPEAVTSDAGQLRRFEQEARAAGVLNHPNVLVVLDVGTHEGRPYIVSELLEGETLGARLRRGSLTPAKAIEYGVQLARGLAAAHEKGIVHRDLKPENVLLTGDARVKILDFGLAKLRREMEDASESGASEITVSGAVMGTASYMSPEQVRGQAADARSDIFALGIVLHEMLTRRQPFKRETSAETMTAILREDPPGLEGIAGLAPGIERVVRRCLEKEPAERFQSTRDLAFALEAASDNPPREPAGVPSGPTGLLRRVAVGAVLVLLGGAAGWGLARGLSAPSAEATPSFKRLTFRRGNLLHARLAADGETIVYSAAWDSDPAQVFMARADGSGSRSLDLPGADVLSISRTGELAVLVKKRFRFNVNGVGTLARVPLAGGTPREVLDDVYLAAWSPDGSELAVARAAADATRVEFPIGHVVYQSGSGLVGLAVAPDAERVALLEEDAGRLVIADRQGHVRTLFSGWARLGSLAWVADDRIVFSGGPVPGLQALRSIGLDGSQRMVFNCGAVDCILHDAAPDGRILIERRATRKGLVASPGGAAERDLSWLDWSAARDISSDGTTVLFVEAGEGGRGGYLRKTDGSLPVKLGDVREVTGLSPDGKWAIALTNDPVPELELLPTGAGEARILPMPDLTPEGGYFLPDGRRLIALAEASHGYRAYVLGLDGASPRPLTPEGMATDLAVSPDSRHVAFNAGDGRAAIYPIDGGEARYVPGLMLGESPLTWLSDGRALLLTTYGEAPAIVWRFDLATGKRVLWRRLMPTDPAGVVSLRNVYFAPDGRSYAYSYTRVLMSDLYLIEGAR